MFNLHFEIFFAGVSQTESTSDLNNHQLDNSERNNITEIADDEIVMEHNYAREPSCSNIEENNGDDTPHVPQLVKCTENAGITIKLKYLNDDLKLVDGKLDELLGDFKK